MHLQLVFILDLGGDSPHEIARRAMNVLGAASLAEICSWVHGA